MSRCTFTLLHLPAVSSAIMTRLLLTYNRYRAPASVENRTKLYVEFQYNLPQPPVSTCL
jgi:hypothetical protein